MGTAKTLMDVRMAPPDSVVYFCRTCGAKDCKTHDISQRQISRGRSRMRRSGGGLPGDDQMGGAEDNSR